VSARTKKKEKYNYELEAEKKNWAKKITIIQMKEKKRKS
jgi:hypothetical protein